MNIIEINVADRVLISRRPNEKEVAVIKGFTPKGTVIVKDSSGQLVDVTPEQVIKKF